LQNSKKRGRQNFVARPSRRVFGETVPRIELTKAAGWKSESSYDPLHSFRASAPVPLEKFARNPKKSFATQSGEKRTSPDHRKSVVPGLGCVKTRTREEGAELLSLVSPPDRRRHHCHYLELAKSRRNFYAQIQFRSFHTA
jgi:hypothetical protein